MISPANVHQSFRKPFPLLFLAAGLLIAAPWKADAQQYRIAKDDGKIPRSKVGFLTPHPPYPYQARQRSLQGGVTVRVQFDPRGDVASVALVKSSGSNILDSNTTNYIKQNWKSLTGHPSVFTKEIVYALGRRAVRG